MARIRQSGIRSRNMWLAVGRPCGSSSVGALTAPASRKKTSDPSASTVRHGGPLGGQVLADGLAEENASTVDHGDEAEGSVPSKERACLLVGGADRESRDVAIGQVIHDEKPRQALGGEPHARRIWMHDAAQAAT